MVGRDELLVAGEDELDGAPRRPCECGHVPLEVEVALRSEAAAQERDDHAHLRRRDLEDVGDPVAGDEGNLRRRPDGDPLALPLRDHGARLDRHPLAAVREVAPLHDHVGTGHRLVGVTLHDRRVAEEVAVTAALLVAFVRLPVLVDQQSSVCQCRLDLGDCGQGLVLHLDQRGCLLGDFGCQCGHPRDDVALVAHLLLGEQAPVLDLVAVEDIGDVLVREDGEYTGKRPRLRRVDAADARV